MLSFFRVATVHATAYQSGGASLSTSRSSEENMTLQYNRGYSNVTDFTNTAVLNEVNVFSLSPLNKKYANLPEKVTSTRVDRDQAGNITSSGNNVVDATLSYNSYGFLSAVLLNTNTTPVRFIYNKYNNHLNHIISNVSAAIIIAAFSFSIVAVLFPGQIQPYNLQPT